MRLDSCRELKRSLRDRGAQLLAQTAVPWLGLGISRVAAGDYRLAVRLQNRGSAPEGLLRRLAVEAHDEFEIVEVGNIVALEALDPDELQKRQRPLIPGCSLGHRDVTAGTLGAFVTVEGVAHLLSNNHVLGNSGRAELGDPALQPGIADDGDPTVDQVAELAALVPLHEDQPNRVDAAVARLNDEIEFRPQRYPGGPLRGVVEAVADVEVAKIGRTTGHTEGRVTAFEVDGLQIDFGFAQLVFEGQVEVSGRNGTFSSGGDSGSVIWTVDDRAGLGLLFAGSESGGPGDTGLTYANPLQEVLRALDARLTKAEA